MFFKFTIVLGFIISIIKCQVYQLFLDQPLNSYVDCPTSGWDFSSGAYDCFFQCHWDASDQTATNDYGILIWDDAKTAQMQIDGMPTKMPTAPDPIVDIMGAYELRISISLLRLLDGSGSPLWAGSDFLDVQVDGVSAKVESILSYDTQYTCYDTTSWADTLYSVFQIDLVFLFDMSQLPLNSRNVLDISVVPNLTNTNTFYGLSRFKLEYLPCDIDCLECSGSLQTDCQTCPQTQVLQGIYCQMPPCNDKYYEDNDRICLPCQTADCLHCDLATPAYCTECDTGFIIRLDGSCEVDTIPCPDGQWEDGPIRRCFLCDPSCVTCFGGTSADCLTCIDTQYVPPVAPNGPPPGTCVNCWDEIPGCLLCNTPIDQGCTSCDENWFLDAADCVTTCVTAHTWANIGTNKCEPCHVGCLDCVDASLTKCLGGCTGTYYLSATNTCSPYCPDGTFRNTATNVCDPCTGCTTCEADGNDCTSCPGGYIQGHYPTRTCIGCGGNCIECNQEGCIRCDNPGFLLLSDTLTCSAAPCPNGYFPDVGGFICTKCDPSCTQCTGPLTSGCTAGFCIAADGWYYDTVNLECARCNDKCEQCTGGLESECSVCSLNYVRDVNETDTTCVDSCPIGQWPDHDIRECAFCDPNCQECFGPTSTSCTKCYPGSYLNGTGCTNCSGLCKDCQGQPDFCISCGSSTFLKDNRCISDCGQGYYSEQTLRKCIPCHFTCKNCNGLLQGNCIECDPPRFLIGNFCQTCANFPGRYQSEVGETNSLDDCLEICGDGIRSTNQFECDDGNIKDGDGCNHECQIEQGFRCTRQDIGSRDICYPLQVSFVMNLENNKNVYPNSDQNSNINIIINVDSLLIFPEGKSLKDYVVLEIEGVSANLQYTVIQDFNNPFEIVLSIQIPQTIINKELKVTFTNDSEFITELSNRENGQSESVVVIEYYAYYEEGERTQATVFSSLIAGLVFLQMLFFIVFVFGNDYPQIHLTIDILQNIYLLRFSGIKYPLNGIETFNQLEPVFNWYLPRVFSYIVNDYNNQNTYTQYLDEGIDALFWKNADQVVFASFLGIFFYILLKIFCSEAICALRKSNTKKFQKFLRKYLLYFFEYNFFINITQTAAIPIIFYGAIQCTNTNSQSVVIASIIMMCVCGIWILGLLSTWIFITIANRKQLIFDDPTRDMQHRQSLQYFKYRICKNYIKKSYFYFQTFDILILVFLRLKLSLKILSHYLIIFNLIVWSYIEVFSHSSFMQPVFLYLRKIIFPIIIVTFHKQNLIQISIMIGYNFIYLVYLLIANPIRKPKKQNWKVYLQEFLHMGCYIPMYLLMDDTNENTASVFQLFNIFNYILIVFLGFSISYLSLVYIIQPLIIKLCKKPDTNVYQVAAIETIRKPKIVEEVGLAQIDNGSSDDNLSNAQGDEEKSKSDTQVGFQFQPKKILRSKHAQQMQTRSTNNNLIITNQ